MPRTSVDPSKSLASREREKTFRSMPPRPSILEVERLSVTRNGTRNLQKVDWTIRQGEHWVLMGANGSGKTTLLSSLLGYFVPTAGSSRWLGETYGEGDWRELR
ncbi:MAG: ATP-binding cassette domain-containing protein, partial [Verrucomicrobiales bacterium]